MLPTPIGTGQVTRSADGRLYVQIGSDIQEGDSVTCLSARDWLAVRREMEDLRNEASTWKVLRREMEDLRADAALWKSEAERLRAEVFRLQSGE